jgi:phospholipase/lecithinase/hemolysin
MKSVVKSIFVVLFLLSGLAVVPAQTTQTAFKSLYVFGDALSATADSRAPGGSYFYGQRWSNGRVWVEVLAQRQGLTFDNTKNDSYYDHNSGEVVTDVANFQAPPDVANDLFIVWVCNADTFDAAQNHDNSLQWILANTVSQSNHLLIIENLYAKGVRTLIMPNAVDISEIPAYNESNLTNVMHNGCVAYNTAFANTINTARLLCPGLTIYTPDYYTLLNNVLTNAAAYGLTNALYQGSNGKFYSIDAFSDNSIKNLTLNGQGTNYIFWDPQDPTAMLHEIVADVAQQIISPVQINWLALFPGINRLDVANVPVGLNGFVDGCTATNQVQQGWTWTTVTNINSTNTTQSIFVYAPSLPPAIPAGNGGDGSIDPNDTNNFNVTYIPPFNPAQFYRLHFPYAWSWP